MHVAPFVPRGATFPQFDPGGVDTNCVRHTAVSDSLGPRFGRRKERVMKISGWIRRALCALFVFAPVAWASAQDGALTEDEAIDLPADGWTSHWLAGAEASFLGVKAETGGIVTLSLSDTTAPGVGTEAFLDGDGYQGHAFAPRLWLGRQLTENWAFVGRFWSLDQTSVRRPNNSPFIPTVGANFATFRNEDFISMVAVDMELVRSFQLTDAWRVDIAGGGRYAQMHNRSDLQGFGVFTTGNFINLQYFTRHDFDGTGVLGSLTSRYRLFDSNFVAYGMFRGAQIYGRSISQGSASGTVVSNPSTPLSGAATVTRDTNQNVNMGIVEAQLGIEWQHELAFAPAQFFFRPTVEFQYWEMYGPPTGGAGFGGTIGELTTNSFASAGLGRVGLLGGSIAMGLIY